MKVSIVSLFVKLGLLVGLAMVNNSARSMDVPHKIDNSKQCAQSSQQLVPYVPDFERQFVHVPAGVTSVPITFDQSQKNLIINYVVEGKIVARLGRSGDIVCFKGEQVQDYNFVLQAPLQAGMLVVETDGGFTFVQPVHVQRAVFVGGAVEFRGAFDSSKELCIETDTITITPLAVVTAHSVNFRAHSTINIMGYLNVLGMFFARARFVENEGVVTAQSAHFKADRWMWNKKRGKIAVENGFVIDALIMFNSFGGELKATDIMCNAGIDCNFFGLYAAKNTNINALVSANAGFIVPQLSTLKGLITRENALRATESLLLAYAPPAVGMGYTVASTLYNKRLQRLYLQGCSLCSQMRQLTNTKGVGVSDWVSTICETKNFASSILQYSHIARNGYIIVQQGRQGFSMPGFGEWGDEVTRNASMLADIYAPHLSRNTLIDCNIGLLLGGNGQSNSLLWNGNGGLSLFAHKYVLNTRYGHTAGVIAAPMLTVRADRDYRNIGTIGGYSGLVSAQDIDMCGRTYFANNLVLLAGNKAKVDGTMSAHTMGIQAQEVRVKSGGKMNAYHTTVQGKDIALELGSKINTHSGVLRAEELVQSGAEINSNDVGMQGKNITLELGSKINTHSGALRAEELVKSGAEINSHDLGVHGNNIRLESGAKINTHNGTLRAQSSLLNNGTIEASETLISRANNIQNDGLMNGNYVFISADRLWKNNNRVQAKKSVTINALMAQSSITATVRADEIITTNIAFDSSPVTIYRAPKIYQNSLFVAGISIALPNSLQDVLNGALTVDNGIKALEMLLTYTNPYSVVAMQLHAIGFAQRVGNALLNIPNLFKQGCSLYTQVNDLRKNEDAGASDWVATVCNVKNWAFEVLGTVQAIASLRNLIPSCHSITPWEKQFLHTSGGTIASPYNNDICESAFNGVQLIKDGDLAVQTQHRMNSLTVEQGGGLKQIATMVGDIFGPQFNRDVLYDRSPAVFGVNVKGRSLVNRNLIAGAVNTYQLETWNGGSGAVIAGNANIQARGTYSVGRVLAGSGSISAGDLNVSGPTHVADRLTLQARNRATIAADINAGSVGIQARQAIIQKGVSIATQDGASVVADSITNAAHITGRQVSLVGKTVDLQNGSALRGQGDHNAVFIKANERLSMEQGSALGGAAVVIDAASIRGADGNTIQADHTYMKTAELDNKGTVAGDFTLQFTGDEHQLKSIGNVDDLYYSGTLESGLADRLAEGRGSLLNVNPSGSVNILADHMVHFKEQHVVPHGLTARTTMDDGCIKSDKLLQSGQLLGLASQEVHHSTLRGAQVGISCNNAFASSAVERVYNGTDYEDRIRPVTVEGESIDMHISGVGHYEGTEFISGKGGMHVSGEGKLINKAVMLEKHTEKDFTCEKHGTRKVTKETSTTVAPCTYSSEGVVNIEMETPSEFEGTQFNAKGGTVIRGGMIARDVYDTHQVDSYVKKDGEHFGQSKSDHTQSFSSTARPMQFNGDRPVTIESNSKIDIAFTGNAPKVILNAPEIAIRVGRNESASTSHRTSSNILWESERDAITHDVTYGQPFKGIIETHTERFTIESVEGLPVERIVRTNVTGNLVRTWMKEIHEKHSTVSQAPTKAASAVVCGAVVMLTGGVGTALGAKVVGSLGCANVPVVSAIITRMTSSTVTTLSAYATDALLRCNGDLNAAVRSMANHEAVKSLIFSVVTSGAMAGAGDALDQLGLPAMHDADTLGRRLLYAAPRQATDAAIRTVGEVFLGNNPKDAWLRNMRFAAAATVGMACTSQIGDAYAHGRINPVTHKILHTAVGATEGALIAGKQGAIAGGTGALVAELISDVLAPAGPSLDRMLELEAKRGLPFSEGEFAYHWNEQIAAYLRYASSVGVASKLTAASVALLARQDVDIAQLTAANAIDNNFVFLIGYGIVAASVGYSAYSIYAAYDAGGIEDALYQLGIEVGTHAIGGVAGRIAGKLACKAVYKVGTAVYPTARAAINAALKKNPGLRIALGRLTEKLIVAGEKLGESAVGAHAERFIQAANRLEGRIIGAEGKIQKIFRQYKLGFDLTLSSPASEASIVGKPMLSTIFEETGPLIAKRPCSSLIKEIGRTEFQAASVAGKPMLSKPGCSRLLAIPEEIGEAIRASADTRAVSINQRSSLGHWFDSKQVALDDLRKTIVSDDARKAIISREDHWVSLEEARALGFRGDKVTKPTVNKKTGLVDLNTELPGRLEHAEKMLEYVKQEFEAQGRQVVKNGSKTIKEDMFMKFYEFKDGSRIQIRTQGKSGHPKFEINDVLRNIKEKITFVERVDE